MDDSAGVAAMYVLVLNAGSSSLKFNLFDMAKEASVAEGAAERIGLDEAILEMRKGEKRTLIIPYWLGYGEAGKPPAIPPRATLVFDVELVDFH